MRYLRYRFFTFPFDLSIAFSELPKSFTPLDWYPEMIYTDFTYVFETGVMYDILEVRKK
jgi:hypothetical protein